MHTARVKPFAIFFAGLLVCSLMVTNLFYYHQYENQIYAQQREESAQEYARIMNRTVKAIKLDQLNCMALNIYFEARGEPFLGQVAVARVVMNRVLHHSFPSDPCKVIYQKHEVTDAETGTVKTVCQFSWVCENLPHPPQWNEQFQTAKKIARDVLQTNKWHDLLTVNTLFFHHVNVRPGWLYKPIEQIGNHIFYAKENKSEKKPQ